MEKLTFKLKHPRILRDGDKETVEELVFREATAGDVENAMNSQNGHTNTLILAGNLCEAGLSPDELRKLHSQDFFALTTQLAEFTGLVAEAESGK